MLHTTLTREIEERDGNIFRALNQNYGFNFEKTFKVAKIEGNFTINKVLKEIGETPSTHKIVCLMISSLSYRNDEIYGVEITGSGTSDYDVEHHKKWFDFPTRFDDFFSKGQFNDNRKDNEVVYIISQNKEDLSRVWSKKEIDIHGRLTKSEIEELGNLKRRYSYMHKEDYYFDKSGYCVSDKREELERNAEKLRRERKENEFKSIDNMETVKAIRTQIEELKSLIVDTLARATNSDQIRKIEKSLSWYQGLGDCFSKYENIRKGEEEKTFASQDRFNEKVKDVTEMIESIKERIA